MLNMKLFILILINAGGEGKTTIARLIRALLQLGGQHHLGLDADQGNFALKTISGADLLTKTIGWGVGAEKAHEIVAAAAGLPTIMDTGAGTLASQREIVELLPTLRSQFEANGYRTVVLLPISPNKIGAAGALDQLAPKLLNFEHIVVKNDRDGSAEFGTLTNDFPVINLPHLEPGLNAYLFRSQREIADVIVSPEPDFEEAAPRFAQWVRAFASEAPLRSLLGEELCARVLSKFPPAPKPSRFVHRTFEQVYNSSFRYAEHVSPIMDLIDSFDWTPAGLRLAADELERRNQALVSRLLRVPPLHEPGQRSSAR